MIFSTELEKKSEIVNNSFNDGQKKMGTLFAF